MIPQDVAHKPQTVRRLATVLGTAILLTAAVPAFAAMPATIHVTLGNLPSGKQMVNLDRKSVKAGKVTFDVSSISKDELHDFRLVKTKLAAAKLPMNADGTRVDEAKLKGIHELGDINAGKMGTRTVALTPGHYVLFSNQPGHYTSGMETDLTVTK